MPYRSRKARSQKVDLGDVNSRSDAAQGNSTRRQYESRRRIRPERIKPFEMFLSEGNNQRNKRA